MNNPSDLILGRWGHETRGLVSQSLQEAPGWHSLVGVVQLHPDMFRWYAKLGGMGLKPV